MEFWQFDDGPINVGIDIGWSDRKKSCALAVEGLRVREDARDWKSYIGEGRPVAVALFRYKDLLQAVQALMRSVGPRRELVSIVLDGPIGPGGLAQKNRSVDAAFGRGAFYGRMQPSPVETGSGPRYAAVTDELVRTLYAAAGIPYRPAWWDGCPKQGFICCETHPTVGLALLLPPQDRETLPSRGFPRWMVIDGLTPVENKGPFRAKSDWYWQLGSGDWVAEILKCPVVANEVHHERVAGLYCLAVANRLAVHREDDPTAVAVGGADGVYVLPSDVDRAWEKPLIDEVGIQAGQLLPRDRSTYLIKTSSVSSGVVGRSVESDRSVLDETDGAEKGDAATLILNNASGIWERQNDWLTGLETPVYIRTVDSLEEMIRLEKVGGEGQWMPSDKEHTPLRLARRRGFTGKLMKSNAWTVSVVLV